MARRKLKPGAPGGVAQTNHQTLEVHVHNQVPQSTLAGRLTGLVLDKNDGAVLPGCEVSLFFGPLNEFPISIGVTDSSGTFSFEGLPPGFYALTIAQTDRLKVILHNLRVLPGEDNHQRILVPTAPSKENVRNRLILEKVSPAALRCE